MSSEPEREPQDAAGDAVKASVILAAIAALVALKVYDIKAAGSVVLGAAVGIVNLVTMQALIRKLVRVGPGDRAAVGWAIFAAVKILLLLGVLGFLLTRHYVDPMPLVVGYMVMPFGIAASAVWSTFRSRS